MKSLQPVRSCGANVSISFDGEQLLNTPQGATFLRTNFAGMSRLIHVSYLLLVVALFWSACSDGFDMERPTTELISPASGQTVNTGQGIQLLVKFTDNGNLLQYKMRLEGIDSLNGIARVKTYRLVFIEGISGSEFLLEQNIPLPNSTFNGYYRIILSCIDDDGNESYPDTAVVRIVNILDSVPPVFEIEGIPGPHDTLKIGMGIALGGRISDETSLDSASVKIANTNGSFKLHYFNFLSITDNAVDLTGIGWWFPVDSTWTPGTYSAYFTAWDNYSGVDTTFLFQVRP